MDRNIRNYAAMLMQPSHASAKMHGSGEYLNTHGIVRFYQTRNGVLVAAEISGLPHSHAGLMVIAKEKSYSTEYAKDVIMGQGSAVGSTIMSGSTIELTVSLGIQKIKIPDVQFMTEAAAVTLLEGIGLQVTVSQEHSETVKAGLVITQNPASGTQATSGDTVAIVVSKGASSFAMPNVVDMREEEAKSLLKGKGISVTVNYEYSTSDDVGKVLEQSVKADTQVYAGSTMTITVSTGQELFTVPDVTGKAKTEAETLLKDAGFTPKVNEVYSETVAAGTVISQSPDADSSQPKGTQILITVSLGQKPITVPDVVGKTKTVATSLLESAGFVVHVQYSYDDDVAANLVISQSPAGKKTAYSGNTVILMVSKGPQNIAPTNLLISPSASSVDVGGTVTITDVITPSNATDKTVTYKSSNTSIATVSSSGIVTGVAPGTVTITATTNTGGISASYQITVNEPTITLNYSRVECTVPTYRYVQLEATPSVSGATVTWSSSNIDAATVDSDGMVYIENAYLCTITASIIVGGKTYSASCELSLLPEGMLYCEEIVTMYVGDEQLLFNNVAPHYRYYDASGVLVESVGDTSGSVTSSNDSVATVDGLFTIAHSPGTTTISIQAADYYDEITVIVKERPTLELSHDTITAHVGDGIVVRAFTNMSKSEAPVQFTLSNWELTDANNFFDYEACLGTCINAGTTVLTASMTVDGITYTETCTITVEPAAAISVQVDTVYVSLSDLAANNYQVSVPIYLRQNAGMTGFGFGIEPDPRLSNSDLDHNNWTYYSVHAINTKTNYLWVEAITPNSTYTGLLGPYTTYSPTDAKAGDMYYINYSSGNGVDHWWQHETGRYDISSQITWTNGAIIITE